MARRKDAPVPIPGVTPKWAEGLTHRERLFVEEYLTDLNGTAAMVRIGTEGTTAQGKKYANRESASVASAQMRAKPEVVRAIEIALNEVGVTRLWIIDELGKIARADLSKFLTIEGGKVRVYDHDDIDPGLLPLLSEVSQGFDKDGNATGITVKLKSDSAALRYLAKLLRMEVDRTEISGPDQGPIEVQDPAERIMAQLRMLKARNEEAAAKPKE